MEHAGHREQEAEMRNPATVTLIRHGQSAYNQLKETVKDAEAGKAFRKQFNKDFYGKHAKPREDLDIAVLEKRWPSKELYDLALEYYKEIRKVMNGMSDFDTPLTQHGALQAQETGERIADHIPKPDVIYVSPYLRTRETLEHLLNRAPDDWMQVPQWEHQNVREQEHGMQTVFNDWRLSYVFEPVDMLHSIKEGPYTYQYKGGESQFNVRDRVSDFMGRLRRKHAGEHILVVTHHLTILSFLAEVQHWTREKFLEWDEHRKPSNCGVTVLRRQTGIGRSARRDVLTLNDDDYNKKLYEE